MKTLLALIVCCSFTCFGQKIVPGSTEPVVADSFVGYDNLGFAYLIYNNTFTKKKNTISLEYKNLGLGKIERADILNPLKIALFYSDFNTVVLLDNQLNEIRQINFSEFQRQQILVQATGNASRNRLWIFNGLTLELALYDHLRNEYQTLTQPLSGDILYYETDFNNFRWIDENNDWYECDIYGKITFRGKVPGFDAVHFTDTGALILRNGDQISYFDSEKNLLPLIEIDAKSFKSFYYSPQNLAIFTTIGITNYKLTLP